MGEHAAMEQSKESQLAAEIDHRLASQLQPRDTIVVSGFWRSGTTWLQEYLAEILGAKTIFEPFHFKVRAAQKLFKHYGVAKKSESFHELFIPYCAERTLDPSSLLYRYYDGTLRADLPGRAVRVLRQDASESERTRVVVKFTRGQFSLAAAHRTFAMPIIHLYRDPRAVVASAKMTDWYWLFDHLSLQEQLLEVNDGRADYFRRDAEALREYDRDKIARIAAYWASTEKFLRDAFAEAQSRIVLVSYEKLCRQPESVLEILAQLNVPTERHGSSPAGRGDSFSTSPQRRGASAAERIGGWTNVLSSAEIAMIESIVEHFGLNTRGDEACH